MFIEDDIAILTHLIETQDIVLFVIPDFYLKNKAYSHYQSFLYDILKLHAGSILIGQDQLSTILARLTVPPKMVITDDSLYGPVAALVPEDILLTTFSILYAHFKGNIKTLVKGAQRIDNLKDGDTLLISEGCPSHCQKEALGKTKVPEWLIHHTQKQLNFEFTTPLNYPQDLSSYALIIHCNSCYLNRAEVLSQLQRAQEAQIPVVNYGLLTAYLERYFERALLPFEVDFVL